MEKLCFHDLFADIQGVQKKSLDRGETLFRQGDRADMVFSVASGELQLLRYTSDGHAVCLHTAQEGESFAEAALFTDVYHCNGKATKKTGAWCYPRAEVLQKIEDDPRCMRQFCQLLAAHVRHLRLLLELRSLRSASDRVLQFYRLRADEQHQVHLSGSLLDVAKELGMAQETFYRTLAELEKNGIIRRLDNKTFLLPPVTEF